MGDDTFRNGPGAPGVRLAMDGASARAARAVAAIRGAARQGLADRPRPAAAATALPGADPLAAPSATYWRRRFVVLAVGLAVLATAAWGLSEAIRVQPGTGQQGSGQPGTGQPGAGQPGTGTLAAGGGLGSGAGAAGAPGTGRTAAGAGAGQAGRTGSGGYRAPRTGGRGAAGSGRPSPRSPGAGGFGGFKPPFCSWHSIVLSASAAQGSFAPAEQPGFSLSVVSTQPAACSFNVGPGHLALVIKEGPTRIWSSADCVSGDRNLVTALRRGVPTVVSIGWGKTTSSPGCGPARPVPAGAYTAYAVDGSLASSPVTFRLG